MIPGWKISNQIMDCKEYIQTQISRLSVTTVRKPAEVGNIWAAEFEQRIPVEGTLVLFLHTFGAHSRRNHFYRLIQCEVTVKYVCVTGDDRRQPWNISLTRQREQEWCPEDCKKFRSLSFASPACVKFWKTFAKLACTWKTDTSLVGRTELSEIVCHGLAMCGAPPHNLFVWAWPGVQGQLFLSVLSERHHRELCNSDKECNCMHFQMHCEYSVPWCNWQKTWTAPDSPPPPRGSDVFRFQLWTFQMTGSRMTRNSSKFLAFEVPMIPAGMRKRLFFPLGNNVLPRRCPNEANERFVLTTQWKDPCHF